ncbi:MAG TPA: response regulator [Longimicrobium sp.]|nr:response regulator [Longimicrobium sp.]
MRVLIVDDEPLARERIRILLSREEDVEIVGECDDGVAAVAGIHEVKPDVVFLDVQMPGMTGLEVVSAVGPERMPVVVFVTAYDEYALRAFGAQAIDYLVKPVGAERFRAAVERVRTQLRGRDRDSLESRLRALVEMVRPAEYLTRFMVKRGQRFVFLRVEELEWIEAADNYVKLHANASSELLRASLAGLEARLDPRRFVRVHRGAIINVDRVTAIEPWGQGEYLLTLAGGARITSSRTYRARIRQALGAFDVG